MLAGRERVAGPAQQRQRDMPFPRLRRVAFLTSSSSWRGSSVVFADLAQGLARRGHPVRVLVAAPALAAGFRAAGLDVALVRIAKTGARDAWRLGRAVRQFGADTLLADTPRDLRVAALAALACPLALVHCYNVFLQRPPADLMTRWAYRRVRLLVFPTATLAAQVLERAPFLARVPHRVISNGVDPEWFRPDQEAGRLFRRRHSLGDGPLLLAVGALEPVKRWAWLFEAVALLGADAPPLVLCGTGSLDQVLRARASGLALHVRFLGHVPRSELVGAYNAATCLVHAATAETFGLSLAEAMACGRPVVAPAAGSAIEVVGDAGVLVAPDDPQAFAGALARLLADPGWCAALGAAARARVRERFSLDRMVRDYAAVVEDPR